MLQAILLNLLIPLVVAGLVLWVIEQFPIDPTIKQIIRVVVIVVCVVIVLYWLVGALGGGAFAYPYPRR